MKKNIIQILENSISDTHYQKYLKILAKINEYRMYTKSDLDIRSIMTRLRISPKSMHLVMLGSSSVSLNIYNKIIKLIERIILQKRASISYMSIVNIFKENYAASSASKSPIQSNIQMSQCYIAPNEKYSNLMYNKSIRF